jgi:pimeloyl-ACP methyl ester carboxylesterase
MTAITAGHNVGCARRTAPVSWRRVLFMTGLLALAVLGGCAKKPPTGLTDIKANSYGELESYLLSHPADIDTFKVRGPFSVDTQENRELLLPAGESITGDLYLAEHSNKAPLIILLHGYGNSKADHGYQAMHLATWGLHALALNLPEEGPWANNGRMLAQVTELLQKNPALLAPNIDGGKIVLVGHSFGGSSVAIALGRGAPVLGGVLLDPAIADGDMRGALPRIRKPVILIGADEYVSETVGRGYFYYYMRNGIIEISVRDAAHEDATFSLELTDATDEQLAFVSSLTASAFSLAATGKPDYAWAGFSKALRKGTIVNPKKK